MPTPKTKPSLEGNSMPDFTLTRQVAAPVEAVWAVLEDFGGIQSWSSGVKASELTSNGPVGQGSTRHCDFSPAGGVNERVDRFNPNQRLTVNIFETSKLPISNAIADFAIAPKDGGTELTLNYDYTPNLMGRFMFGMLDKQMRKGMDGLATDLQRASESGDGTK